MVETHGEGWAELFSSWMQALLDDGGSNAFSIFVHDETRRVINYSRALPHCMCQELDRSRGEEAACAVRGETRRALPRCVCLELDRSRGEETALAKSNK